ncbi:MAG: 5-methyltetrahydropteroyltriglutamate--homocysteine S-methyltransferase [Rhodospirillaceae bacterium]|nr:5-methyltetrahydropteroyltriglutamate--homocysteine S-methyltransferase [Rhodospirillaceae bacterium]
MTGAAKTAAPPFRADQVGSLLRPGALKDARERFLGPQTPDQHLGPHHNHDLQLVEDRCICDAVAMQEGVGLKAVTDGEFRRRSWWLELLLNWEGISAHRTGTMEFTWHATDGKEQPFSRLWVNAPIRWKPSPIVRAYQFLKDHTHAVPKVTIPAPILLHMYGGGDKGIREGHYKDIDAFWHDLTAAYRQELTALTAAGARYIQLDDTSIAFLCDPKYRATVASWGNDPDKLLLDYARRMNDVLAGLPADVTVTMHQCRGNREGGWSAEGGYDPVADVLFNQVNVHGFFLEYDTARAGSFEPLKLLPKGKIAVLGLVSTKTARVEGADELKRRIDEAARYAPLDQLALSPQCGFASSIKGNPLTPEDQKAKLARIVEVARDVWNGK